MTTSACGRSLTAGRARHHERQRIQECSLTKNNIPTRITLREKAKLRAEGGELVDYLQCCRSANGRHDFNPDARQRYMNVFSQHRHSRRGGSPCCSGMQ